MPSPKFKSNFKQLRNCIEMSKLEYVPIELTSWGPSWQSLIACDCCPPPADAHVFCLVSHICFPFSLLMKNQKPNRGLCVSLGDEQPDHRSSESATKMVQFMTTISLPSGSIGNRTGGYGISRVLPGQVLGPGPYLRTHSNPIKQIFD